MNSRRSGLGVSAPVTHSRTAPSDVPDVEFGAFPASLDPDDRGFYTVDPGGERRSVEFREVDGQAVLPHARMRFDRAG